MTSTDAAPRGSQRVSSVTPVHRLRTLYETRPVGTAAALFAALAAVRLAGAYQPVMLVLAFVVTPAVLVAGSRRVLNDAGLRRASSRRAVARGCAVVAGSYAATVGLCVLLLGTGPDNWAAGLLTVFTGLVPAGTPGSGLIVVGSGVVCLGVLVPIAEEACYRGLLLHAISQRHSTVTAVVATSAGWALVHLGDYGLQPFNPYIVLGMIPSVFVMGLALGWCRVVTGSVVASAAAQGAANLMLAGWVLTW